MSKMFQYEDENGNFIIEHLDASGNLIPVFQVTGSEVFISGSLLPSDPLNSASAELGSETYPWKELYVESASINFIDTKKAVGSADRKVRFSRKDVEDLKKGKSLNEDGIISASGDMHVVGSSTFKGKTFFEGVTSLRGFTEVSGGLAVEGNADFKGQFRVNGNRIKEGELRVLEGLTATTDELNLLDGVSGLVKADFTKLAAVNSTATELNLLDGITHIKDEDNMSSNSATSLATQQSIKAYVDANAGGSSFTAAGISGSFTSLSASIATDINNAGGADFSSVGENIIPDGDNTRDLGSSTKEFRNLYIDGTANLDIANIDVLNATTTALIGIFHINKSPTSVSGNNVLLDARSQNHFVAANKANIIGIRGAGIVGQIVTVHSTGNFTVHHTENGVSAKEQFQLPLSRDLTARGPVAHQFIYVDAYWLKLY